MVKDVDFHAEQYPSHSARILAASGGGTRLMSLVRDAVEDPDGYFWHAIVHRQEPDPGNSAYWFHKAGDHPIFPKLTEEAAACGCQTNSIWDPFRFIRFCETASNEHLAMKVQLVEWQLLFDHCARGLAV